MSPAAYRPTKTKVLVSMGLVFKNTLILDKDISIDSVTGCRSDSSEIFTKLLATTLLFNPITRYNIERLSNPDVVQRSTGFCC